MRISVAALTILMLQASVTYAEESVRRYDGVPEAMIEKLAQKDLISMFKVMSGKVTTANQIDEPNLMLEGFSKQLEEKLKDTGEYMDANLYREENFGERYSVLSYIVNYGSKPIGVTIRMYNGQKGWYATNMNFTPDIEKFVNELRGIATKENPKNTSKD